MADIIKLAVNAILAPIREEGDEAVVFPGYGSGGPDGPLELNLDACSSLGGGILEGYMEEGEELLGKYRSMSSPGEIILYGDALCRFFWAIIARMLRKGHVFWIEDLNALASLTVLKTWRHEQFHLFVDIQERLAPGRPTAGRQMEEALACAHSWLMIHEITPAKRPHPSLLRPFLALAYDYGRKPGYSDWPKYDSDTTFETGLLQFLNRPELTILEANGVPVGHLFIRQLPVMDEVSTINTIN